MRDPFFELPGCHSATDLFAKIVPNAINASNLFFENDEPSLAGGMTGSAIEQTAAARKILDPA